MKKLPETEDSLLIRTDFSNDAGWDDLCAKLAKPHEDGFKSISPASTPLRTQD